VQVFAVDLISHLSVQYALPKSLSTARLAVNAVSTLLTVLASQAREELILTVLAPLTRYLAGVIPFMRVKEELRLTVLDPLPRQLAGFPFRFPGRSSYWQSLA
jgi:hypothetical protein